MRGFESGQWRPHPDHAPWCVANSAFVDVGGDHGCNCPAKRPSSGRHWSGIPEEASGTAREARALPGKGGDPDAGLVALRDCVALLKQRDLPQGSYGEAVIAAAEDVLAARQKEGQP